MEELLGGRDSHQEGLGHQVRVSHQEGLGHQLDLRLQVAGAIISLQGVKGIMPGLGPKGVARVLVLYRHQVEHRYLVILSHQVDLSLQEEGVTSYQGARNTSRVLCHLERQEVRNTLWRTGVDHLVGVMGLFLV